ncbi:NUDIX hydrolase [Candidatus Poribacteria bacterium]|nr:NUDIX hydrolase [Candidatus Poribacteria bacterium]
MYVTEDILKQVELKYGSPDVACFHQRMVWPEFELLVNSMKHDRAHDVTLFIFYGSELVTIRKHMHPAGVFRAPSGGLRPGEDFEEGTLREAYEETGLQVQLDRYILRAHVTFVYGEREIQWTSHVFTAKYLSGEMMPIDTKEIAEVRQVSIEELQTGIRDRLLASGSGGLAYRVALTDKVVELLRQGRFLNVS